MCVCVCVCVVGQFLLLSLLLFSHFLNPLCWFPLLALTSTAGQIDSAKRIAARDEARKRSGYVDVDLSACVASCVCVCVRVFVCCVRLFVSPLFPRRPLCNGVLLTSCGRALCIRCNLKQGQTHCRGFRGACVCAVLGAFVFVPPSQTVRCPCCCFHTSRWSDGAI